MATPKKFKNDIDVYANSKKELLPRRQELLDEITKSDTFLPDSILHDDLDSGMLSYVEKEFKIVSDEKQIPIIPRILTIQRWGELTNTWEFVDDDNNIQLPFISVVRKPDVQPGTNPSVQRTIPDRKLFHYSTVKTWNGTQNGANVYKIPQPIPVDVSYEVSIVCNKFRDLNKFNKIVMERFCSRQDYTVVKGHFIPIILERIEDTSPMDTIDGRRFYIQNYQFTMLGFLIDSDEFEVKPAISRVLLMTEFVEGTKFSKTIVNKGIDMTVVKFTADGIQSVYSVGESINILLYVTINGLLQRLGVDYYHVVGTSKITFVNIPTEGSVIVIAYYKGKSSFFANSNGRALSHTVENFIYDGSGLIFTVENDIDSIIALDVNGLVEINGENFNIVGDKQVMLNYTPVNGSTVGISYLY